MEKLCKKNFPFQKILSRISSAFFFICLGPFDAYHHVYIDSNEIACNVQHQSYKNNINQLCVEKLAFTTLDFLIKLICVYFRIRCDPEGDDCRIDEKCQLIITEDYIGFGCVCRDGYQREDHKCKGTYPIHIWGN